MSEQEDTSVLGPGGALCPAGPPPGRVQHVRHYLALEACCCADYQSVLEDRGPLEQSSSQNDFGKYLCDMNFEAPSEFMASPAASRPPGVMA